MNKNVSGGVLITLLIVAIIAILVAPFIFIWSLNTLFGLTIAFGFFEWLAALFLLGFLNKNYIKMKNSE
jgi:hypothetical protein